MVRWISTSLIPVVLLLLVCAASASPSSTDVASEKSGEIPRRHGLFRPLLFGNALSWILAIKAKIVIIAVAVALAMAGSAKFWGPGFWKCSSNTYEHSFESPYSSGHEAGPWVEEYPGHPGKTLEERSDNNLEVESLTSRVMKGLEFANLGYRAITEGDESVSCRAQLACEARQIAKESPPLAKMLDIFGSSLHQYDANVGDDCKQIGCTSGTKTEQKNKTLFATTKTPNNPRKSRRFFAPGNFY